MPPIAKAPHCDAADDRQVIPLQVEKRASGESKERDGKHPFTHVIAQGVRSTGSPKPREFDQGFVTLA